jgi:hypothetical protein
MKAYIMKLSIHKHKLLITVLIILQSVILASCGSKVEKIGILGFYLDMDKNAAKSKMDSLLKVKKLQYFETSDLLGNKQTNLYCDFPAINPLLSAKVNLRSTYIIDERLTSIRMNLCSRPDKEKHRYSDNCDLNQLNQLFESFKKQYGKPTLLSAGEKYDWLSKELPTVYMPGEKGRLLMDKIYYWNKGNYVLYFDFGYPERLTAPENGGKDPAVAESLDWTSVPIVFYDFTRDYIDNLLEKASKMQEGEFRKKDSSAKKDNP